MALFNDRRDRGPSYDPTKGNEVNRLFEYNEGYGHGRAGAEYKGYGGRGAAIAYGAGYKHGKADAPAKKPARRTKS